MKIEMSLEFSYDDENMAKRVYGAVKVDNYDFVEMELRGTKIRAQIKGERIKSVTHTADDLLACMAVAERTAKLG